MQPSDKPLRVPDYRLEEVDGDAMLFHPARDEIHQLNSTAALIWQLCDGARTVSQLIALLQESYPEAAAQIPGDVEEALRDLEHIGCLRPA